MPIKKLKTKKRKTSSSPCTKCSRKRKVSYRRNSYLNVTRVQKPQYSKSHVSNNANGLLPKERCYLLSIIKPKSRLAQLKSIAQEAILKRKIFTVYGYAPAVQKALLERGWVEKLPPERMHLAKIKNGIKQVEKLLLSNIVGVIAPNFMWFTNDLANIDLTKLPDSLLLNKLQPNASWTSKQGLNSSLESQHWYYIPEVSEVSYPRTYNVSHNEQISDFIADYRITACTNLLKWILAMVSKNREITSMEGNVPIAIIVFSLNRCKEFLDIKQNKDIDKKIDCVRTKHWDVFLSKYYKIIGKIDTFERDRSNKLPLYLVYAKFLLQEMHKCRPQLSCEGCHNVWIFKPTHSSRGRGIRLASKLSVINKLMTETSNKYVIQKYIEEPLLIYETKFDIRQYYLVTSTYPLVIWMYKDCYLKYSSQRYNLKSYHESIHLTNNAIQKHYPSCPSRHPNLPKYNMWDLETFKLYLEEIGMNDAWSKLIYPGMKKSIIGVMLSSQDSLTVSRNRFELYGCDFILDKSFNPWLMEINSRPDLSSSTPVTAMICPHVIEDVIKVVIDYPNNPNASTGKFTCVYRQSLSKIMPNLNGRDTNLVIKGFGLPRDYFCTNKFLNRTQEEFNVGEDNDFRKILFDLKQAYVAKEPNKQKEETVSLKLSGGDLFKTLNTEAENESIY